MVDEGAMDIVGVFVTDDVRVDGWGWAFGGLTFGCYAVADEFSVIAAYEARMIAFVDSIIFLGYV